MAFTVPEASKTNRVTALKLKYIGYIDMHTKNDKVSAKCGDRSTDKVQNRGAFWLMSSSYLITHHFQSGTHSL